MCSRRVPDSFRNCINPYLFNGILLEATLFEHSPAHHWDNFTHSGSSCFMEREAEARQILERSFYQKEVVKEKIR